MAHVFFDRLEDRRSTQVLWGGYSAPGNYYSAYGLQTGTYQDYSPYTSAMKAYHAALGPYNPYYFPWYPPDYPSGHYPSYNQISILIGIIHSAHILNGISGAG